MKVTSKIDNATLLLRDNHLSTHIPRTQPLSRPSLLNMLQSHPFVYLKPNDSAQGKGILRVDTRPNQSYLLRSRDNDDVWFCENPDQLWIKISHIKRKRFYILQQGIASITKEGNPFDIRVHVTRVNQKWVIAGIIGRLASFESIVTNYFMEGPSTYVSHLLTEGLQHSEGESEKIINQLKSLSLKATETISRTYPTWSEFGVDIGIDPGQKLWIYEINITPGADVFKRLNYESYSRVLRLRKQAR